MIISAPLALAAVVVLGVGLWVAIRASRQLEWGVLLLLFFMPFERIPSFDVGPITLKVNHFLGGLLVVLWLLAVLFNRRKLMPNPLSTWVGFFVVGLSLALFGSQEMSRSIAVLVATLFSLGLFLLLPQIITQRDQLQKVVTILGLTTVVSAIFGLYQFGGDLIGLPISLTGLDPGYIKDVFGFPRIQAFSQEPLYFGNFLLLPLSVALAFLVSAQQWFSKTWLIWFVILAGTVFALTLSRGAFVGLAGSLLVLVLFYGKQFASPKNILLLIVGLGLSVGLVGGILQKIDPDAVSRFTAHLTVQDFGKGESTVGRLQTWYQAADLWQESPAIGVGPGNFGPAILNFPPERPPRGWPIVNNQYFELLAETGLLGLTLFGLLISMLLLRSLPAYQASRDDHEVRPLLVGLTAAVVGILFQYNFFSTLYINPIWITFGLLVAVQTIALMDKNRGTHP